MIFIFVKHWNCLKSLHFSMVCWHLFQVIIPFFFWQSPNGIPCRKRSWLGKRLKFLIISKWNYISFISFWTVLSIKLWFVNNLSFQETELKIMTLSSCLKYWFWSYVVLLSSFFSEKVMIFICAPMRTFLFWHFLQNLIWLLWSFESYHSLNLSLNPKGIKKDVVSIPFLICVFSLCYSIILLHLSKQLELI